MKLQSTRKEQKALAVAAYNGGFAQVRETRHLKSEEAIDEVQFLDVAERVETDSIVVNGVNILEQNYDSDLVSKQKLLERYVDRTVRVHNAETGEELEIRLLSVAECIIGERTDTKEIVIDPAGELILPALPEGFLLKPALVWKIEPAVLDQEISVSYLTKSLEWQAHYTLELKEDSFQLLGWVKILNQSGGNYENAQLMLVAGQVNRQAAGRSADPAALYARLQSQMAAESLPERFVYRVGRPVTILNEQLKQLAFLQAGGSQFKRTYCVKEGEAHATVQLELSNTAENGLDMPLPEGLVQVYESGDAGELFYTGEDAIGHTAAGESICLQIGQALDIESESFEKLREKHGGFEYATYVYKLINRKPESIRLSINHFIYGHVWEMESSSHDYERKSSSEVEFTVRLQPGKAAEMEFTYKIAQQPETRVV